MSSSYHAYLIQELRCVLRACQVEFVGDVLEVRFADTRAVARVNRFGRRYTECKSCAVVVRAPACPKTRPSVENDDAAGRIARVVHAAWCEARYRLGIDRPAHIASVVRHLAVHDTPPIPHAWIDDVARRY